MINWLLIFFRGISFIRYSGGRRIRQDHKFVVSVYHFNCTYVQSTVYFECLHSIFPLQQIAHSSRVAVNKPQTFFFWFHLQVLIIFGKQFSFKYRLEKRVLEGSFKEF